MREHGINTFFSVGVAITEPIREAIRHASGWTPAIDADGDLRDGAEICEITGPVPVEGYADGTRFIVRREAAARRQALGAETHEGLGREIALRRVDHPVGMEGLKPGRQAPVWRMDAFRDRFLTAFRR